MYKQDQIIIISVTFTVCMIWEINSTTTNLKLFSFIKKILWWDLRIFLLSHLWWQKLIFFLNFIWILWEEYLLMRKFLKDVELLCSKGTECSQQQCCHFNCSIHRPVKDLFWRTFSKNYLCLSCKRKEDRLEVGKWWWNFSRR